MIKCWAVYKALCTACCTAHLCVLRLRGERHIPGGQRRSTPRAEEAPQAQGPALRVLKPAGDSGFLPLAEQAKHMRMGGGGHLSIISNKELLAGGEKARVGGRLLLGMSEIC